jgi:NifU-like protein involved in Fe-S cluster formation
MSDPEYSELVVDHFERPRNLGILTAAHDVIQGKAGSRVQGAEFVLTARIANSKVAEVRFEAYGCPHCIAAGSVITGALMGGDLEDIQQWSWRELAQQLQIPTSKRGRLLILEDAVRAMAADWAGRLSS